MIKINLIDYSMTRFRLLLATAIALTALPAHAQTKPSSEDLSIKTAHFALEFYVGNDGRLYQEPLAGGSRAKTHRDDEAYPQFGDGYIWEPALLAVHSDGNTSTDLQFDHAEKEGDTTRLHLHDPAYPFNVTLCFRAHPAEDLIEQWVELRNDEPEPRHTGAHGLDVIIAVNQCLLDASFFGDWANEMHPVTEPLTPGIKTLDSKIGVRAHQFGNPSFVLSFNGPPTETSGKVLAGSLEWSGSFQCSFANNAQQTRALCGINPFDSAYHLAPGGTFVTPTMIWVWSDHGLGDMSRKFHSWARDFGIRDGHKTRSVLLNNWEATQFDFDFNRIVGLFDPAREIG